MAAIQLGMCFRPFVGWGLMTAGTMMQLTQTVISYGNRIHGALLRNLAAHNFRHNNVRSFALHQGHKRQRTNWHLLGTVQWKRLR